MGDMAAAGLTAYGDIQEGKAGAQAAEFERAQYEEQGKMAQIQALDEESDRMRRLNQVMASNRASASAMGVLADGGSFLATQQANKVEAGRDIGRIRLNGKSNERRFSLAAEQSRMAGKAAMKSGYIRAAGSLLQGVNEVGKTAAAGGV